GAACAPWSRGQRPRLAGLDGGGPGRGRGTRRTLTAAVGPEGHGRRRASQREVAVPARELDERRTCSILGDRNLDLREQLVRLESGRQMSDEEVIGPELARTAQRAYVEARPERNEGGRQLG